MNEGRRPRPVGLLAGIGIGLVGVLLLTMRGDGQVRIGIALLVVAALVLLLAGRRRKAEGAADDDGDG